jgi:hypothetical protein
MQNPDLEKTWLMPEEFSENKLENAVRKQAAVDAFNNPEKTTIPVAAAPAAATQGIKIENTCRRRVYIKIWGNL